MANILDDICEPGPLLTPEAIEPPNISKATERCISKLSQYLYRSIIAVSPEHQFFDHRHC